MARKMSDPAYRILQIEQRMNPHVAPINKLVATLQNRDDRGWAPEVAPVHGGINARILSVLRDPGRKTRVDGGSGFLCIENDDPTAEAQCKLFAAHGISPEAVLPWNAYPWYIDRAPNAAEKNAGAEVLGELIDLVPALRVVLLQGNDAADVWRRLTKLRPSHVEERKLIVVESIHPSPQALRTPDPVERQQRKDKQQAAFRCVAKALQAS